MLPDKAKLGTRFTCFSCGTKFYDLNRPVPNCPECDTDQTEAPIQDLKAMLSRSRRMTPVPVPEEPVKKEEPKPTSDDDDLFDNVEQEEQEDDE